MLAPASDAQAAAAIAATAEKMGVDDVYPQARRKWVRLHEKGSKRHEMPCLGAGRHPKFAIKKCESCETENG